MLPGPVTQFCSTLSEARSSQRPFMALVTALIFSFYAGFATAQVPTDFLAYWQLEETTGPVIDSGGTNDGVATSGVERGVPGVVGNAARFGGNINSYVRIPHTPDFPTTEVTILAWVKFDVLNGGFPMFLSGGGNDGLGWDYALYNQPNGSFRAAYAAADGSTPSVDSTTRAEPGVWYHVAMTHDGTNLSIYVNGVMEKTIVAPPLAPSTRDFYLGREARDNCCFLAGYLDEVQLYGRGLLATEVEAIVEAGVAGEPLIGNDNSAEICESALGGSVNDDGYCVVTTTEVSPYVEILRAAGKSGRGWTETGEETSTVVEMYERSGADWEDEPFFSESVSERTIQACYNPGGRNMGTKGQCGK